MGFPFAHFTPVHKISYTTSHARRYVFKSLSSDPPRAKQALGWFRQLFDLERQWADLPPDVRLRERNEHSRPIVEKFFSWCDEQALVVLVQHDVSPTTRKSSPSASCADQWVV